MLPFSSPIQFNLVLKYNAACLFMKVGHLMQHSQYICMYLRKTFLIINYFTVLQIFMIKNILLPIIISILRSTLIFKNNEFILWLESAKNISHSWENCKYWYGFPITGIPPYITTYFNKKIIITNMNLKFKECADTLRNDIDAWQMGDTLSLELIHK